MNDDELPWWVLFYRAVTADPGSMKSFDEAEPDDET